jgi:CheY-like chemotaxis protein/DNA-binding XRE family transcriptional regulator
MRRIRAKGAFMAKIQTRGDTIRALRNRAGLTQRELAEKSGVGLRTIQFMEKGDGAESFFIDCVASALGLSRSDLFQPLGQTKTQPPVPLPGIPLTKENQATYGINTKNGELHVTFGGTDENLEAVKQVLCALSVMLDHTLPALIEFRYMRKTASLDIGVKLPVEHLHELVRKLIAGELDRIPLEPPGIASIDRILIPAETLSNDAGDTVFVGIMKIALRSNLEKLAKGPNDDETTVTLHADGSAVVQRNAAAVIRRLMQQHGATTEGLDSPSDLGGYFTVEPPPPFSLPDDLSLGQALFGKNPHPKKKWWDVSPSKSDPWSSSRPRTKHRILVADSDPETATLVATSLLKMGHVVQIASDGFEAVQAAVHFPHPQIVLLCIGLRGMNGYEAMKRIRQQLPNESIRFIAITKKADELALASAFHQSLSLPVKAADVQHALELIVPP